MMSGIGGMYSRIGGNFARMGRQIQGNERIQLVDSTAIRIFLIGLTRGLERLGGACAILRQEVVSITGLRGVFNGEVVQRVSSLLHRLLEMLAEEAQNRIPGLRQIAGAGNYVSRTARAGGEAAESVRRIAQSLLRTFAQMRNAGGRIASNPLFSFFSRRRTVVMDQMPLTGNAVSPLTGGERMANRVENIANNLAVVARTVEGVEGAVLTTLNRPEAPLLLLSMLMSIMSRVAPAVIEGAATVARHTTGPALQGGAAIILLVLLAHMLNQAISQEGGQGLEEVQLIIRRDDLIEIIYAGETLTLDLSEAERGWAVLSLVDREEDGSWEFPVSDRVEELPLAGGGLTVGEVD